MIISASSVPTVKAFLPDTTSATSRQGSFAYAEGTSPFFQAPAAPPPAAASAEESPVSLTAASELKGYAPEFAPVYAEIWKGGAKVAEIDIHGGVTPLNGLVAAAPGTVGSGGALLAARRAAEIVQSIGGEIRVAGQIIDSRTLDMRAKLQMAYVI